MIYSRELGLRVAPDAKATISAKDFSTTEALTLYHRLKGGGKTKLFFESSALKASIFQVLMTKIRGPRAFELV